MATGNPYPPPADGVLAEMCLRAAWQNDLSDQVRQLLEWASERLPELKRRELQARQRAEHLEAECERLQTTLQNFDKKGGAAC